MLESDWCDSWKKRCLGISITNLTRTGHPTESSIQKPERCLPQYRNCLFLLKVRRIYYCATPSPNSIDRTSTRSMYTCTEVHVQSSISISISTCMTASTVRATERTCQDYQVALSSILMPVASLCHRRRECGKSLSIGYE